MNDIPSLPQTFDPNGGLVQYGSDAKLWVQFQNLPIQNNAKSKDSGRPVFDTIPHVRIRQPGERDETVRPVIEGDKVRFERQWRLFQNAQEQIPEGTPISILFPSAPGAVETLKYMAVHTVEQLADITDTAKQNIGLGASQWQQMAKAYLEQSSKGKEFHAIMSRIEKLEEESAAKDARIASLSAELTAIQEDDDNDLEPVRRRGRPPKSQAA